MKNTLSDLNNHLFLQLERINNEALTKEELEFESERSKAVTSVAKEIISNARLVLDANLKHADAVISKPLPSFLE